MDNAKEEIKARLPIEEVVGQYIELKRAGRNLKGRSPWGVDRTPSFMVSPEKGIWHDFSANKGGDIFSFVMEVEGISFREALEKLAAQAGVELKRYSGGDKKVAALKKRASDALELACKYYQFCLAKNKTVCEYVFYKRNLNRATVKNFRIGYSPSTGRALKNFLAKRGFTEQEMAAAGLTNRHGQDFFWGRMQVPFIDTSGKVIGFTARVLGHDEPKYLNTVDTLLFNKSRFIFGFYQAKPAIRQEGYVVIVEGNMDVISSHQAGVATAVATSGTAMTEYQLKSLARLTSDIRLAYDGDDAGVRATERAIMLAGNMGINLSVISNYHGAKDPDELIQKDPKLWQQAVAERQPAIEWLLNHYEEKLDLSSGDGKREYSNVALRLIGYLHDPVEKKHYEQLVARRLDVSVDDLLAKKIDSGPKHKVYKSAKTAVKSNRLEAIQNNLLSLAVYGGLSLPGVEIPDNDTKLAELELVFEERYAKFSPAELEAEARALQKTLKVEELKAQIKTLETKLTTLPEDDEESLRNLLRQITNLQKEIAKNSSAE